MAFLFNGISKLLWGSGTDITQLQGCQLFGLFEKAPTRCLFNNCSAVVQKTGHQFQHQLVITRILDQGEELDDSDTTEFVTLMDVAMCFHSKQVDGEKRFCWKNTDKQSEIIAFELLPPSSTPPQLMGSFEEIVLQCIYERAFSKSHESATREDLLACQGPMPALLQTAGSSGGQQLSGEAPRASFPQISVPQGMQQAKVAPAVLYMYSSASHLFLPVDVPDVLAGLYRLSNFEYYFVITTQGQPVLCDAISTNFNFRCHRDKALSITWTTQDLTQAFSSWAIKVDPAQEDQFLNFFGDCVLEATHSMAVSKMDAGDANFARAALLRDDDDKMMVDTYDRDEEEDSADEEPQPEYKLSASSSGPKNSHMVVGTNGNRTFVSRGGQIGVFDHRPDGEIKFHVGLDTKLTPKKLMMHQRDQNMLFMDQYNSHSMYQMDMERGEVVEEWKLHDDIKVVDFAPASKFAPTTSEATLRGIASNGLCFIDPRVGGTKIQMDKGKNYGTNYKFTTMAVTGDGGVAVGSEKGEIRLYNDISKNAKTSFPGIGDPIIGIDTTADGMYVLGTCRTYLIIVNTTLPTGDTGFNKPLGKNKGEFIRLQLRPQHIAEMGSQPSFTPARFNVDRNSNENVIITSSGPFVITWNFDRVKEGKLNDYKIKKFPIAVVADNFRYGNTDDIVVALPHDVFSLKANELRKL